MLQLERAEDKQKTGKKVRGWAHTTKPPRLTALRLGAKKQGQMSISIGAVCFGSLSRQLGWNFNGGQTLLALHAGVKHGLFCRLQGSHQPGSCQPLQGAWVSGPVLQPSLPCTIPCPTSAPSPLVRAGKYSFICSAEKPQTALRTTTELL